MDDSVKFVIDTDSETARFYNSRSVFFLTDLAHALERSST
jgi:hypothetical protein